MQSLWGMLWALRFSIVGLTGGAVAIVAAIYYGPRKMLETWDWYLFRFRDRQVLAVLENHKKGLFGAPDIAMRLGRRQASVVRSLDRLRASKRVMKTDHGRYYAPP
jgi:DNA-binding MarR family transcriptional regulator